MILQLIKSTGYILFQQEIVTDGKYILNKRGAIYIQFDRLLYKDHEIPPQTKPHFSAYNRV